MAGYDKSSAFLVFLMMMAEAEFEEHQLEDHEEEDQGSDHNDLVHEGIPLYERLVGGQHQGGDQEPDLDDIVDDAHVPLDERAFDASAEEQGVPSDYGSDIDLVPAGSQRLPVYKKPRLSPKEYAASRKMTSKRRTLDRSRDRFDKQVLMNGVQGTTEKESITVAIGSSVVHRKYEQVDSDEVI